MRVNSGCHPDRLRSGGSYGILLSKAWDILAVGPVCILREQMIPEVSAWGRNAEQESKIRFCCGHRQKIT